MKPWCYNRPPRPAGSWKRNGGEVGAKPRYRWVPFRMSTDCGSWKTGPGLDLPDPVRFNWTCAGCRWEPYLYQCKFCGAPSRRDPSEQLPPADYCHEGDHE